MKTVLVNIPDKESEFFNQLIKKFGFASRTISDEEKEDGIWFFYDACPAGCDWKWRFSKNMEPR